MDNSITDDSLVASNRNLLWLIEPNGELIWRVVGCSRAEGTRFRKDRTLGVSEGVYCRNCLIVSFCCPFCSERMPMNLSLLLLLFFCHSWETFQGGCVPLPRLRWYVLPLGGREKGHHTLIISSNRQYPKENWLSPLEKYESCSWETMEWTRYPNMTDVYHHDFITFFCCHFHIFNEILSPCMAVTVNLGWFFAPGNTRQCQETFLVVKTGGVATGI